MLLNVVGLSKSFGPKTVLHNLSFTINQHEKVGLIGSNGVGKTTLFKILVGQESADSGSITFGASTHLGYLPQSIPQSFAGTVEEWILESIGNLRQLSTKIARLEAELAGAEGDHLDELLERYGELTAEFQLREGYDLDYRIETVTAGLGIDHIATDRPVASLSGGEKARVGLAVVLLRAPNLLLLDEPTNHLDTASLEWLEGYLSHHNGGSLVVSHDRQFLNRVVTRILEIDEFTHQATRYEGDYDDYRQAKAAERRQWEDDYRRQQEEIQELRNCIKSNVNQPSRSQPRRDNDKFIPHFKGQRLQKSITRDIRATKEKLERIEAAPIPRPPKPMAINASIGSSSIKSDIVVEAAHVCKSFGQKRLLDDVSFVVQPSTRIVISGPNGSGKTTLLRIILGLDEPDQGEARRTAGLRVGYLPQEPAMPDPDRSVFEVYRQGLTGLVEDLTRGLLRHGLFRFEDLHMPVGALSLGQKRRLEIARLIATQPHMLVLDEPTNYLSLDVLEEFESALSAFPGPVIAVSHDRWFIEKFEGQGYQLEGGIISTPD